VLYRKKTKGLVCPDSLYCVRRKRKEKLASLPVPSLCEKKERASESRGEEKRREECGSIINRGRKGALTYLSLFLQRKCCSSTNRKWEWKETKRVGVVRWFTVSFIFPIQKYFADRLSGGGNQSSETKGGQYTHLYIVLLWGQWIK